MTLLENWNMKVRIVIIIVSALGIVQKIIVKIGWIGYSKNWKYSDHNDTGVFEDESNNYKVYGCKFLWETKKRKKQTSRSQHKINWSICEETWCHLVSCEKHQLVLMSKLNGVKEWKKELCSCQFMKSLTDPALWDCWTLIFKTSIGYTCSQNVYTHASQIYCTRSSLAIWWSGRFSF